MCRRIFSRGKDNSFSWEIKIIRGLLQSIHEAIGSIFYQQSMKVSALEKPQSRKKVLDPQGPFMQRWNKIFVISCLIAVSVDPLFFYLLIVDEANNCIELDRKLGTTGSILRSFTDIFYVLHIIFQFKTGFIAPASRVFGRGVLVEDSSKIARQYLTSYFVVDILAVLPLPQVVVMITIHRLKESSQWDAKNLLMMIILFQYVPRLTRIIPLYMEVTRSAGIITETAWAGAAFNLLLYMLASHVLGAFWYVLSIHREDACWKHACSISNCNVTSWYCGTETGQSNSFIDDACPIQNSNSSIFDFGMYLPALQNIVQSRNIPQKFFYCFWWGLLNLGSVGQNLSTSTYFWEVLFAVFICISGLVLLALLIGNMQVPMFEKMNDRLMDAMCECLKPALYTEESRIVREGDPVNEILFIMSGELLSVTTNGGRTGFFNSDNLKGGDFCGEELLTWALDPNSSSSLPISTRTVKALSEVEGFALAADDLKCVATQFQRLHSKQLRHTFRFYSQQWRTWAACFIQAAWRRYSRKKLEESLSREENKLQVVLVKGGSNSLSLGAAIYASSFAVNALRAARRKGARKARLQERLPVMLLQKPPEPDFSAVER